MTTHRGKRRMTQPVAVVCRSPACAPLRTVALALNTGRRRRRSRKVFNTTVPNRQQHRAAGRRSRTTRHIATATLAVAIAFAAGCGTPEEQVTSAQAPAVPELDSAWQGRIARTKQDAVQARVTAAAGSDRHLENLAADLAVEARVAAAAGSDRHLENLAAEAVEARVARAQGSDFHLENLAAEAVEARVARAQGSDRHLENLAAEAQPGSTEDEVRRSDYFASAINRR